MKRSKLFLCALLSMIFVMMFGISVHASEGQNGLVTEDGLTYYYVDGVKQIDYEVWTEEGIRYFGSDGAMVTGWNERYGELYYYGSDGVAVVGAYNVEGTEYWFRYDGCLWDGYGTCVESDGTMIYQIDDNGVIVDKLTPTYGDWTLAFGEWYYYETDGSCPHHEYCVVNDVEYYFEEYGELDDNGKKWYSYDEDEVIQIDGNGVVSRATYQIGNWTSAFDEWFWFDGEYDPADYGWKLINNIWYWFDGYGRMLSDEKVWDHDNASYYYLGANGAMVTSQWVNTKPYEHATYTEWYYFGADGKAYTGVKTVGSTMYYFNDHGSLYSGDYSGMRTTYDATYIVEVTPDGVVSSYAEYAINDWTQLKEEWYWFKGQYQPANYEWIEINGSWYYFEWMGRMVSERVVADEGDYYYVDASGRKVASTWIQTGGEYGDGLSWYYFGSDGKAYRGIQKVGQTEYYFEYNGELHQGSDTIQYDDTYLYKIKKDGVVSEKKAYEIQQWVDCDGEWYYFESPGVGAAGFKEIDGNTYYFQSGKMMRDCLCWDYIYGGVVGAVDANGHRIKNAWYLPKDSRNMQYYFFEADGSSANGWKLYNGAWYYLYDGMALVGDYVMEYEGIDYYFVFATDGRMTDQIMVNNGWILIGATWYYWDGNGLVMGAWKKIDGYDYFFDYEGRMTTSMVIDDGSVVDAYGHKVQNTWVRIYEESSWAYAGEDGKAVTGWKLIGSTWYWFDEWGEMADEAITIYNEETGKKETHNFASSGAWLGEQTVTAGWSYYNHAYHYYENGSLVYGWKMVNGKWYYFDKYSGQMYSETCEYIDGKNYVFTADGALANGWMETEWGTWFFAGADGVAKTGWQLIGNTWYYFNNAMCDGLTYISESQEWHLFADGGAWLGQVKPVDGWNYYGGEWYYFEDGEIVYGWVESNGQTYYLSPYMVTDCLDVYVECAPGYMFGKDYYCGFNADGTLARNCYIYTKEFGTVYCDSMGMFYVNGE